MKMAKQKRGLDGPYPKALAEQIAAGKSLDDFLI